MKKQLNSMKERLSDKDIVPWHDHTCATNRAGLIVSYVKREIRAELPTQAWCKFYELLSLCDVVPKACLENRVPLHSLHLCEAPGAFITALNHFAVLNDVREWEWRASTLNPYYEGNPLSRMISDDRFILQTLPQWEFGADDTGDLMTPANALRLLETCPDRVNLVTADGSVDCQGEPAEQERIVTGLHLAEVFCALRCLQPSGTLVIKMFTFYEAESVSLLYLLNCCFSQVSVVKPSCSKSGNSEVYVVCRDRLPAAPSAPLLDRWQQLLAASPGGGTAPLFAREDIPDSFLQQLVHCSRLFKAHQESEISRNLSLYEAGDLSEAELAARWQQVEAIRLATLEEYLQRCQLWPIHRTNRLTHPPNNKLYAPVHVDNKAGRGTYQERTGLQSAHQLLRDLAVQLAQLQAPPPAGDLTWTLAPPTADFRQAGSRALGRRPARLLASKFCSLPMLKVHLKTLEVAAESPDHPCVRLMSEEVETSEITPRLTGDDGVGTVVVTVLPVCDTPWMCTSKTVHSLLEGSRHLQPDDTLVIRGLFLFHRLNLSLTRLLAPFGRGVSLLPPSRGVPGISLQSIPNPGQLTDRLVEVEDVLTSETLSLLPVTELCVRPAAEQLVSYNDAVLWQLTQGVLTRCGAVLPAADTP